MDIHKITPSVDHKKMLKCLNTQLNEQTIGIRIKLLRQRIKKNVIIKLWGLMTDLIIFAKLFPVP